MRESTSVLPLNKKRPGVRSSRNAAPTLWNTLPDKLYQAKDTASIRRQMKSHLFSQIVCFSVFMLYVAWKRGLPRKFARFVLFRLIKKRPFNLLCVLDLFSERWQSTLFQIFFLMTRAVLTKHLSWTAPLCHAGYKMCKMVDCLSEKLLLSGIQHMA